MRPQFRCKSRQKKKHFFVRHWILKSFIYQKDNDRDGKANHFDHKKPSSLLCHFGRIFDLGDDAKAAIELA